MDDEILTLLETGQAADLHQAEEIYLDRHLDDLLALVASPLTDEEFRRDPFIRLLLSHGSRPWEDSLT